MTVTSQIPQSQSGWRPRNWWGGIFGERVDNLPSDSAYSERLKLQAVNTVSQTSVAETIVQRYVCNRRPLGTPPSDPSGPRGAWDSELLGSLTTQVCVWGGGGGSGKNYLIQCTPPICSVFCYNLHNLVFLIKTWYLSKIMYLLFLPASMQSVDVNCYIFIYFRNIKHCWRCSSYYRK